MKTVCILFFLITVACYGIEQMCPVEQIENEILNARTKGLQVSFGDELDFSSLKCGFTKSEWEQSSVSGMYCRDSNIIILRRSGDDLASTKYHEFQHYKNNMQLPFINERHPFDLVDDLFNEIDNQNITREKLALTVRIVLMILWDEIVAFQLDIACSNEHRFTYSDDLIIYILKESYIPRFKNLIINDEDLKTIYNVAKKTKNLNEFESDTLLNVVQVEIIENNIALNGFLYLIK